jgi:hypothetical protein
MLTDAHLTDLMVAAEFTSRNAPLDVKARKLIADAMVALGEEIEARQAAAAPPGVKVEPVP